MSDARINWPGEEIDKKIDEIADLCEVWVRNREKGRTPSATRKALIAIAREIIPHADEENRLVRNAVEFFRDMGRARD